MRILYVEPFLGGSHQKWIEGYQAHSQHEIDILGLPDKFWKWRMLGGAVALSERFNRGNYQPDVIMVSDMLDLATFKSLIDFEGAFVLYFHENQITYPISPGDKDVANKRDNYYGFVNFTSALVADEIWFNSLFHQTSFLEALPDFLQQFPDHNLGGHVGDIVRKSQVMPLGLALSKMDGVKGDFSMNEIPLLLWNHRLEYDKNPHLFFESLLRLKEENIAFELVVLGEKRGNNSREWSPYKEPLNEHILHWGFVASYDEYAGWLNRANILPVTSGHDYFGISVIEAINAGCFPLLPNDLAYPEHISEGMKSVVLYERGDFYNRLKTIILQKTYKMDLRNQQHFIRKYDWTNMAKVYDEQWQYVINR